MGKCILIGAGGSSSSNIDASKITSGILDAARIPNLSANKITSDTLNADRIPNLNTSKITAGTLGVARGGTGVSTTTEANKVFAYPSAAPSSATAPSFRALVAADIPNLNISKLTAGTLGIARGGTGATTFTANAVLTGNTTSALKTVATASGAFYATAANGAAKFGTLPVAQGGTGSTASPTKGGIIYASSTTAYASTAAGTAGQLLVSNGANAPT